MATANAAVRAPRRATDEPRGAACDVLSTAWVLRQSVLPSVASAADLCSLALALPAALCAPCFLRIAHLPKHADPSNRPAKWSGSGVVSPQETLCRRYDAMWYIMRGSSSDCSGYALAQKPPSPKLEALVVFLCRQETAGPLEMLREALLFWALQEIQRQRERISDLEGSIRRLCAAHDEDPAPHLLPPRARHQSAGGTAWVSGTPLWDGGRSAEQERKARLGARATYHEGVARADEAERQQQQQEEDAEGEEGAGEGGRLSRPQHSHSVTKLVRLTGRRSSIEEILPLLQATTPEQALMNARMLRAAEHIKRVYGGRPTSAIQIGVGSPPPQPPQGQEDAGGCDDDGMALRLPAPLLADVRQRTHQLDKLAKLTGRRGSLTQITALLNAQSPVQALENARTLYTAERIKKRYGDRPVMHAAAAAVLQQEQQAGSRPRSQSSEVVFLPGQELQDGSRTRSMTIDSGEDGMAAAARAGRPAVRAPVQSPDLQPAACASAAVQAMLEPSASGTSSSRSKRGSSKSSKRSSAPQPLNPVNP
eukprot:m51a1_g1145 hypothetical protein (538) ;mRNA; f:271714-278238